MMHFDLLGNTSYKFAVKILFSLKIILLSLFLNKSEIIIQGLGWG